MNLIPSTIKAFFKGFSDRGQEQVDALTNSAKHGAAVKANVLMERVTINFPASGLAVDDYIGLTYIRQGANILWHDVKIVADEDASDIEGEVGFLQNSDATFVKQATLASGGSALTDVVPDPDTAPLAETQWVGLKLKGTVPTSGKATFFVPYLATN